MLDSIKFRTAFAKIFYNNIFCSFLSKSRKN